MDSTPGTTSAQPDTTNDAQSVATATVQTGAATIPPTDTASSLENNITPAQTTAPATQTGSTVTPTANVIPSGQQGTKVLPYHTIETCQQTTTTGTHPGPAASQGESTVSLSTTAAVQSGSTAPKQDTAAEVRPLSATAKNKDSFEASFEDNQEEYQEESFQQSSSSLTAPSAVNQTLNTTWLARRKEFDELRAPAGRGQWKIYELPGPCFGPLAPVKPKLLVLLISGGSTVTAFHSNQVGRNAHVDKLLDSVMTFQVGSTTILPIRPSIASLPGLVQKVVPISMLHLKADHLLQEKEIRPFIASAARVRHNDTGIEQLCSHLWRIQQNPRFRTEEGKSRKGCIRAPAHYFDSTLPLVLRILFHPEESQHQFWLPQLELGHFKVFHNPDLVGGKGPIDALGWRQKPLCDLYVPEEFVGLEKLAANEKGGDDDGSVNTFRWMTRSAADTMTPLADSLRHLFDEKLELELGLHSDQDPSTQGSVTLLPGWDPELEATPELVQNP